MGARNFWWLERANNYYTFAMDDYNDDDFFEDEIMSIQHNLKQHIECIDVEPPFEKEIIAIYDKGLSFYVRETLRGRVNSERVQKSLRIELFYSIGYHAGAYIDWTIKDSENDELMDEIDYTIPKYIIKRIKSIEKKLNKTLGAITTKIKLVGTFSNWEGIYEKVL